MAIPESDITTAGSQQSLAEKHSAQSQWDSTSEEFDNQKSYERGSEDAMSEETLQGMPFDEETSAMSKIHHGLKTLAITLLPSPIARFCGYKVEVPTRQSPTAYLDGMRGVASFCVYLEHVAMKFHPLMFEEYGDHPYFWQLPIIRLAFSGSVMVAIFFVISGFALALRPLELIYEKDWERLYRSLSSATFRRAFRIVLPPMAVTFVIMLLTRTHVFDAKYSGTVDMDLGGPIYQETLILQFVDWLEYVFSKLLYPYEWTVSLHNVTKSEYAAPLYTIPKELWCSFLLFITLTGLGRLRPVVRLGFTLFLIYYAFWCMRYDISCFLCGMLIAEHHVRKARSVVVPKSMSRKLLSAIGWSAVLFAGLWLASIPHIHGSYGSTTFGFQTISAIISWESNVFVVGSILIVWAISNLPLLQRIFTSPIPRYLGQISFGLYLVHWPILASWGWRLQPAIWKLTGNDTDFNHAFGFTISFICITPVVIFFGDLFWRVVDLGSIKLAKQLEADLIVQTL
ncbi:hypothetical protein EAE96_000861 [Botrytis aclada]|nr:hypothetical protein EAE96_000861 [Botrytis aclada]